MGSVLGFSRIVDRVNDVFAEIASWFILASCVISAGNAAIRYVVGYSSNAWLEVQWYLFGGVVLLGAAQALRLNEHVRVDLVYGSVSDRARLWIDVVGLVVFLLPVTICLTWLSWPFFWTSFVSGEQSSNAGGLMRWPAKLVLPLGFAMLCLQGLSEIVKRIAALRGDIKLNTTYEKPLQ